MGLCWAAMEPPATPSPAAGPSQPEPTAVPVRQPNKRLRLAVLVLALFAGPLLAEGLLRLMIFSSSQPGDTVRDPQLYADPAHDDAFYKLQYLLAPPEKRRPPPGFDPIMGWVGHAIEPRTYAHRDAETLAARRPVLLYGASYAQCASGLVQSACFQHVMAGSDLADDYALLNYGVGNGGIDQSYLMLKHTLDGYAEQKPVVVIGLVLETDFDRCMLTFRGWAKPHFTVTESGELSLDGPVIEGTEAFLAAHPLNIRSYLWRLLLNSPDWLPDGLKKMLTGYEETLATEKELVTSLVVAIQDEVASRGLDAFFVLFCRKEAVRLENPAVSWQHDFVPALLDEYDFPYVLAAPLLTREGQRQGRDPVEFFIPGGPDKNHPTAEGNELLFELIRQGMNGVFDGGTAER